MNDKKIWMFILIILLLLALGLTFTGYTILFKEENWTIRIGAIIPLSGPQSNIGQDMREGIDFAAEDFNKKGQGIQVIYEDSAGNPKTAIAAYQKLRVENISVFITAQSHVTLALAPLAEKDEAPLFTIAVAPSILDAGNYTFVNNFNGEQEQKYLTNFIRQEFKGNKIAILSEEVDFGVQYKQVLEKEWSKAGGEVVAAESFASDSTDYRTQLTKIKNTNPDFIYLVGYAPHLARILIQIKELGIKQQVFSYWGAHDKLLIDTAKDSSEGLIFPSSSFSKDSAPDFFVIYNYKYRRDPHYRAGISYDIIGIIVNATSPCELGNTSCIKDEVYKIKDFEGVTGPTTINSKGGTEKEIVIWQVKGGKFVRYN